jgi:GntR family transcriptional regulator / MocR family aminotransferase
MRREWLPFMPKSCYSTRPIAALNLMPVPTRYREIYDRIRPTIAEGKLRPGDRLPSAHVLAAELKVARGTVDTAYTLLADEGFLVAQGGSGTSVSPHLPVMAKPSRLAWRQMSWCHWARGNKSEAGSPGMSGNSASNPRRVYDRHGSALTQLLSRRIDSNPQGGNLPPRREAVFEAPAPARGVLTRPLSFDSRPDQDLFHALPHPARRFGLLEPSRT